MKSTDKITIVFIVFSPQMWKSLEPVYDAIRREEDMELFLIVIDYEVTWGSETIETSGHYWTSKYPEAIFCTANSVLPRMEDIQPDFVFRQTPYDNRYPEQYSNVNLAKHGKLCYIPYNYNFSKKRHLEIEYAPSFLKELSILFSDSNYICEYVQRMATELKLKTIDVYNVGSTAFGRLLQEKKVRSEDRFTFLWIPRWSTDNLNNHGTSFLEYYDRLIDYFDSNDNMELVIRPHPFMFEQFIAKGVLSKEKVKSIIEEVDTRDNVRFDYAMDYLCSFQESDALIADYSSLIVEYFLTGKPILFCENNCDWNTEPLIKEISEVIYYTVTWDELKGGMDDVFGGKDNAMERRVEIIQRYYKEHLSAEKKILNILRSYRYE